MRLTPNNLSTGPAERSVLAQRLMRTEIEALQRTMERDSLAIHAARYHFRERSSFIAAMSSICPAGNFFSSAFPSPTAFNRLASGTVMPNLAFRL
jgi:hypothetical protein